MDNTALLIIIIVLVILLFGGGWYGLDRATLDALHTPAPRRHKTSVHPSVDLRHQG
jgi:hypothetical protein